VKLKEDEDKRTHLENDLSRLSKEHETAKNEAFELQEKLLSENEKDKLLAKGLQNELKGHMEQHVKQSTQIQALAAKLGEQKSPGIFFFFFFF